MSCIHRSSKLMDWISTYDSSSLVSLGPICEDDNGTKWWLLRVTGTVSPPSYHFSTSRFSTLITLSLQIPKNLFNIILFSHKSRMTLHSNIWFNVCYRMISVVIVFPFIGAGFANISPDFWFNMKFEQGIQKH